MRPSTNPNEEQRHEQGQWDPDINRVHILAQTSTQNKGETTSEDLEFPQLPLSHQSVLPHGYIKKKKLGLNIFNHDLRNQAVVESCSILKNEVISNLLVEAVTGS